MLIKIKAKPQVFYHVTINLLDLLPEQTLGFQTVALFSRRKAVYTLLFTYKSSC